MWRGDLPPLYPPLFLLRTLTVLECEHCGPCVTSSSLCRIPSLRTKGKIRIWKLETGNPPAGWEPEGQISRFQVSGFRFQEKETENSVVSRQ
jgi:hypothetical protein